MSYSDDYKDRQHAEFLGQWAPDKLPPLTAENLRFSIACRRKAESELHELRVALATIKRLA